MTNNNQRVAVLLLLVVFNLCAVNSFHIKPIYQSGSNALAQRQPQIVITSDNSKHVDVDSFGTSVYTPNHPSITPFLKRRSTPRSEPMTMSEQEIEIFSKQNNVTVDQVRALLNLQDRFTSADSDIPFKIETSVTDTPLEISATLRPELQLAAFIKDVRLAVGFPACGNTFEAILDLSEWGGDIGKVWKYELTLDLPRVCVSDFHIQIPFTLLCMKVANLAVLQRGIVGDLLVDLSVGVATMQYVAENVRLWRFKVGELDDCYTITNQDLCVKSRANSTIPNSPVCGWCSSTKQCLTAREDKKADLCKICPRCGFFTSSTESKMRSECLSKEACGWCTADNQCHSGDPLGPFNFKVKCDPEKDKKSEPTKPNSLLSLLGIETTQAKSQWEYSKAGKTSSNRGAVAAGILCAIFGIVFGIGVGVAGVFVTGFFYAKKQNIPVKQAFTSNPLHSELSAKFLGN